MSLPSRLAALALSTLCAGCAYQSDGGLRARAPAEAIAYQSGPSPIRFAGFEVTSVVPPHLRRPGDLDLDAPGVAGQHFSYVLRTPDGGTRYVRCRFLFTPGGWTLYGGDDSRTEVTCRSEAPDQPQEPAWKLHLWAKGKDRLSRTASGGGLHPEHFCTARKELGPGERETVYAVDFAGNGEAWWLTRRDCTRTGRAGAVSTSADVGGPTIAMVETTPRGLVLFDPAQPSYVHLASGVAVSAFLVIRMWW